MAMGRIEVRKRNQVTLPDTVYLRNIGEHDMTLKRY